MTSLSSIQSRVGQVRPRGGRWAAQAWRAIANWYAAALGVDNSTLLQFPAGGRFVVMNYAVIPGKVAGFMTGQLLRPSFYRQVRPVLRDAGVHPFPVFLHELAS